MPVAPTTAGTLTRRAGLMFSKGSVRLCMSLAAQLAPRCALPPRRPQHAATTGPEAAAAGEDRIDVQWVVRFALDLVVVGQFLARLDVAPRIDEHAPLFDHRLAIRVAGVVDEARLVPLDTRIDHRARVHDEQEGMAVGGVLVQIAPVCLDVRDPLAQVLDDARALRDAGGGEHAESMQRRVAYFDERVLHTATGARIASWC